MKINKVLTTAVAVTLIGGAFAGCSSKKDEGASPSENPSKSSTAPAAGSKSINILFSAEPPDLDSSKATTNAAFTMINALNEGLYRLDQDGKAQPALAAELPTISADGLTYTIKLRDGLTFSDGSPLTAQNFVDAYKRTVDPNTKALYSFMIEWIKGGAAVHNAKTADEIQKAKDAMGVKALDEKTLEITLEKPIAFFTAQLTFPLFFPQNQTLVESAGDEYGKDPNKVIGAGPFVLKEWKHEQSLTFVKNEKYWDAANVKLDKFTVTVVKDRATAVNLFETKQADLTDLGGDFVQKYKGKPEEQVKRELTNAYLMLEQKKAPFLANKNIRQALNMAIDRQAHVDIVLKNGSVPSTGLVPVGTQDGNNNEFRKTAGDTQPAFDAAKAKELYAKGLEELGIKELPAFKVTADDTEGAKKTLEFILAQWKQNLGITSATADPVPHELRVERQDNKDFDVIIALWGADYNDPMTFMDLWTTTSSFNTMDYSNPNYDKLLADAGNETDPAKRAQLLVDAEKALMDDMGVIPLYFRTKVYALNTAVKGLYFPAFGTEWELKNVDVVK
ncbi:peptide ABC transporter substrate-binding protein [Gorillibacterium sp. CAU 1737]|uniref:peptide ABC transporter substrate-binding protein n=1 Tax=Gorillibacterium sp. CAU 1737 TaxID=3140362 RepID=UPI003261BE70